MVVNIIVYKLITHFVLQNDPCNTLPIQSIPEYGSEELISNSVMETILPLLGVQSMICSLFIWVMTLLALEVFRLINMSWKTTVIMIVLTRLMDPTQRLIGLVWPQLKHFKMFHLALVSDLSYAQALIFWMVKFIWVLLG